MRGVLLSLCAIAIVILSASESYALGRGGNMGGTVCNMAPQVNAAKAENLTQVTATRIYKPMRSFQRLEPAPLPFVDIAALKALNADPVSVNVEHIAAK